MSLVCDCVKNLFLSLFDGGEIVEIGWVGDVLFIVFVVDVWVFFVDRCCEVCKFCC